MLPENFWEIYRAQVPIGTDPTTPEMKKMREEIILAHMYLAKRIVAKRKKTMPEHVSASDYESEAMLGLLQAVQRYNHTRNVPFEAFITQRMHSKIGDAVRNEDWAPRSLRKKQRDITQAESAFRQVHGREPTEQEISDELDIPIEEILDTKHKAEISVHTHIEDNPEVYAKTEVLDDDDAYMVRLVKKATAESLQQLPIRQAAIIALHYYQQVKLREIAKMLRISEVRVGEIHAEAVRKIWENVAAAIKEN